MYIFFLYLFIFLIYVFLFVCLFFILYDSGERDVATCRLCCVRGISRDVAELITCDVMENVYRTTNEFAICSYRIFTMLTV